MWRPASPAPNLKSLGYLRLLVSPPPLPDLPVNEALPALAQSLAARRSVLLEAPPGAGKSTIVPLFLLRSSSWLGGQKILMLEPRRIAARAVAARMAYLLGEPVGRSVGFRTRLETRVSGETRIEVVTEGILTRMLQDDASLSGVGCVIFDEFHERSLNADLGLALSIECQQNLREDLRLLVMSATLDLQPIAKMLGDAPVVAARGRSFDVSTQYVARRPEIYLEQQTAQVVRTALREHDGDILCFLPGAAEIRRVQRALEDTGLDRNVRVLPLYGELEGAAQDAALSPAPAGQRKIVLATSIAETSLTIEGVRVVVDSGLRRYAEFDPATGMSHLVTTKVSQAAADQRRGRAGRLSAGHCYRLWSEGTQGSLAPQTAPEILHADLAPLALELSCWGAVDAASLCWLDPPPAAPLAQARDLLRQLEAIDTADRVTPHGRMLAKLGLHPAAGPYARQSARARRGAPGVRPGGHIERARYPARERRRPRRGSAAASCRAARRRAGSAAGNHRGCSRHEPGVAQLGALATRPCTRPPRLGGSARMDGTTLGVGLPPTVSDEHAATVADTCWRMGEAHGSVSRRRCPRPSSSSRLKLDGAEREARIFLAAPLTLADLEKHFSAQILEHAEISWDDREQAVRARRERRLGALLLDSAEMRNPDGHAMQAAALAGLRQLGIAGLPWTAELRQWRARVALMQQYAVASPEPWPDLSDAALAAALEEWAPPWISGFTRREHFARMDLGNALRSRLTYAQSAIVEREAPTHFTVPSGSHIPIDYLDGEIPTLSVRLQEMFGLSQTPSVAAGRLPLLLKLPSPARRPVQITRDLVSFWNRGYHEVKKDLKGRYPKHYWPEDPYTAEATRRARPRTSR